jgi:protein-L-isoaspartate(D-aspartate) O-methyltransferase
MRPCLAIVRALAGDGRKGWKEYAPYDVIHVGAAAESIPPELEAQLKPGGVLLIPVGGVGFQHFKVLRKHEGTGQLETLSQLPVAYVPLIYLEENETKE